MGGFYGRLEQALGTVVSLVSERVMRGGGILGKRSSGKDTAVRGSASKAGTVSIPTRPVV